MITAQKRTTGSTYRTDAKLDSSSRLGLQSLVNSKDSDIVAGSALRVNLSPAKSHFADSDHHASMDLPAYRGL